jgi:vacuolar protein 8
LVEKLKSSATEDVVDAAAALWDLSFSSPENKVAIGAARAIPRLVQLLREGVEGAEPVGAEGAAENVAGLLANLATDAVNKKTIAAEAGIPLLVKLLKDGTAGEKKNAAGALWRLAVNDVDNRKAIKAAGAIPPLIELLRGTADAKIQAAGALSVLAADKAIARKITRGGAVLPLLELVQTGPRGAKEPAVIALWKCVKRDRPGRNALRAQNSTEPLRAVQQQGSVEAKASAEKIVKKLKGWF